MDLQRAINTSGITNEQGWKAMLDVAKGLEYLHNLHIVHRDLKPQNGLVRILFDYEYNISRSRGSTTAVLTSVQ